MIEQVVLVDAAGEPVGVADKRTVHGRDTPRHLGISCHVVDEGGNVLVTRRALDKPTWPGVWTNAFCGHPAPGEAWADAVVRRGRFELGLDLEDVRCVAPTFDYRAVDASGTVEHERCPVFVATAASAVHPNPDEVVELRWSTPARLRSAIDATPWAFSPWLVEHLPLVLPHLEPIRMQHRVC